MRIALTSPDCRRVTELSRPVSVVWMGKHGVVLSGAPVPDGATSNTGVSLLGSLRIDRWNLTANKKQLTLAAIRLR
jgi:hypothetical protein